MAADLTLEVEDLEILDDEAGAEVFDELLARAARQEDTEIAEVEISEAEIPGAWWRLRLEELYDDSGKIVAWVKAKFKKDEHPRWPAGSPNGKGGEFMHVGEWVTGPDGKPYEISAFQNGKVYAHLATGKGATPKTIALTPVKTKDGGLELQVAPATPHVTQGYGKKADIKGAIVIDPFVDSASHDPSIKPPASFDVPPDQWKRFGQIDQERIHALIDRFGKWSPGKSKKLVNEISVQYDSEVKQAVQSALASQYGGSSGDTISLSSIFGSSPTAAQIAKYEKAKLLLEDAAAAIQWDLYHRTMSPDVCMFHWGHTSVSQSKQQHIDEGIPIMSAYSLSTGFTQTQGFGPNVVAVPLAIRHVQMHTHSGGVYVSYESEYEITTGHRMKLDDRALFASYHDMNSDVRMYLKKHAPDEGEPASGAVLHEALKAMKDPSYELPVPPQPPGIKPLPGPNEKTYVMPPANVVAQQIPDITKVGYSEGTAEASQGPAGQHNFVPGDLMEGLKGTRYLLIPDSDSQSGLRYMKIDLSSGQLIEGKSYPLEDNQPFRKLAGHVKIPPPPKDDNAFVPWGPDQVAALKPVSEPVKLAGFQKGWLFHANGTAYRVEKPQSETGGNPHVIDLSTGVMHSVNSGFKTEPLAVDGTYVPPTPEGELSEPFVPGHGELFLGPMVVSNPDGPKVLWLMTKAPETGDPIARMFGHEANPYVAGEVLKELLGYAAPAPQHGVEKPEAGDSFTHDGKKYVVSSILKDGTVRAKPSGGKVEKFAPGHESLKGLYRPGAWIVGEKSKLRDLEPGTLISGSDAKVRPYLVAGHTAQKTHLLNLETGEHSAVSKNQSRAVLEAAGSELADSPPPQSAFTGEATAPLLNLVPGEPMAWKDYLEKHGEGWTQFHSGAHYWVSQDENGVFYAKKDGAHGKKPMALTGPEGMLLDDDLEYLEHLNPVKPMLPKAEVAPEPASAADPGNFDMSKWQQTGAKLTPADMEEGQIFLSATGLPLQLKSKKPKGGATAVALHNGKLIKNLPYDKGYLALELKATSSVFDYSQIAKGDEVALKHLKLGDKFSTSVLEEDGGANAKTHYVVVAEALGDQDPKVSMKLNGTPFPIKQAHFGPEVPVIFYAHADAEPDVDATQHPPVAQQAWEEDPFSLPLLTTEFYPPTTAATPMLAGITPGSLFGTADGKVLKKVSGAAAAATVVSDGENLWQLPGHGRVKPLHSAAVINAFFAGDKAPEGGSAANVVALMQKMEDVPNGVSLETLEVGDYYAGKGAYNGKVFKIKLAAEDGYVQVEDVETGNIADFSTMATFPEKILKGSAAADVSDTSEGAYAESLGIATGMFYMDEAGARHVVVPWHVLSAMNAGHDYPAAADAKGVAAYNSVSKQSMVILPEVGGFVVPGGFTPGQKVKAYTAALGATHATVVAGQMHEGNDRVALKLPNGEVEAVPPEVVHVVGAGGGVALEPNWADFVGAESKPGGFATIGDVPVGTVFSVAQGATEPNYWLQSNDGTTVVVAHEGGGKFPYQASQVTSFLGTMQVYARKSDGPEYKTFGDLEVGDTYKFMSDPEASSWKVVQKTDLAVTVQDLGAPDYAEDHAPNHPFGSPPIVTKAPRSKYEGMTAPSGFEFTGEVKDWQDIPVGTQFSPLAFVKGTNGQFAGSTTYRKTGEAMAVIATSDETNIIGTEVPMNSAMDVIAVKPIEDSKWSGAPFQKGTHIVFMSGAGHNEPLYGGEVVDFDPDSYGNSTAIKVTFSNTSSATVGEPTWIDPSVEIGGHWETGPRPSVAPEAAVPSKDPAELFNVSSYKVPKDDLENHDFVQLPNKKIAYFKDGKFYALGEGKAAATKAQSFKRAHLAYKFPGASAVVPNGREKPMGEFMPGEIFAPPQGGAAIVLANTGTTQHALGLWGSIHGKVYFQTDDQAVWNKSLPQLVNVQAEAPEASAGITQMKTADLKKGDAFQFTPDAAYTYVVSDVDLHGGTFTAIGMPGEPNATSPFTYEFDDVNWAFNVLPGGGQAVVDAANLPAPKEASCAEKAFFAKLAVGDSAMFAIGANVPVPVTVTNNTIAGQGVEVELPSGEKAVAFAGDLHKPDTAAGAVATAEEEPTVGTFDSPPPMFVKNTAGMMLAALPIGGFYLIDDGSFSGSHWRAKKKTGDLGTSIAIVDEHGMPSNTVAPDYIPKYVWLPPASPVSDFVKGTVWEPGAPEVVTGDDFGASATDNSTPVSELYPGAIFGFEPGGDQWTVVRKTANGSLMVKPMGKDGPIVPLNAKSSQKVYDVLPF